MSRRLACLAAVFLLGACTSTAEGPDPYETTNRAIYVQTVEADRAFFRPLSQTYGALPFPVRQGVNNFASNLEQPRTVVNNALQGDPVGVAHNTFRFLINSTLGIGGLVDVAREFGLEERESGFADTLAVWGVGPGAYQLLPVLGPSTERDTFGYAVDIFLDPAGLILPGEALVLGTAATVGERIDERYVLTTTFDDIFYESADGYTQLRIYYLDSRSFETGESTAEDAFFDPYEDLPLE